jgi:polysaccharide deacetylase 2 family uncharacterized protein YibQ
MPADDLHKPLGLDRDLELRREIPWNAIGYGGLAALVLGLGVFAFMFDNGMGGEPFAVARIETAPKPAVPPPAKAPAVNSDITATIATSGARSNAADVEASTGVRVVRPGGGETPGGLIIQIPQNIGAGLPPAPDRRLVDNGKYGPLPKIGPDGARPVDVYARPTTTALSGRGGPPRVALVVGGLGLSVTATRFAMDKLPPDVTFAFAPYGADLERQAARARADGHETVLQLPMDATDSAAAGTNDSRALEAGLSADQQLDRLSWHLSRFTGYIGVENFLGRDLTAQVEAISPILAEVAKRGLLYLDDGSSPQSVAATAGASLGAPSARADVVVDAERSPEAIAAAFARLEAIARERGSAIGTMSALPATVEQAARFLQGLERRGVIVAPLSALVARPAIPTARNSR